MVAAVCPRCTGVVALHEGRPFVSSSGTVELWHASCFSVRHSRGVEEVTVIAPRPSRKLHWAVSVAAGASLTTFAIAATLLNVELPGASLATIQFDTAEATTLRARLTSHEIEPAPPDERAQYPVPFVDGLELDELFPSLLDWTHPVTATTDKLPLLSTGHFGAERNGIMRRECGSGHCGTDLDGPRGRPIVAVTDGVVVRVERSELGRDGRSGRYVRIEHADGALTAYMHLDTIEKGLEVGDRVDGGQQIGTLGATGINRASPHLHFSLEVPKIPGSKDGDHANTRYVDPAPFLVRSAVAGVADRRHAIKPAF